MNNFDHLPTDEVVDAAVHEYTDSIIKHVLELFPEMDYEVHYDETTNGDETYKSTIADIQTEYGYITIFPDFKSKNSSASLLNRGMIQAMELEGFEDDVINNSAVYGTLMPNTIENAKMFAIILTHDLGLQHQKML